MDFLNDKLVKYIPKALGNADSETPAACYFEKMSSRGMANYAKLLKEKDIKSDADLFCLIVEKLENFYLIDPDTRERKEITTAEGVVNIPGISPLVSEVVQEFADVNIFNGQSKNVLQPSTL